MKNGIFKIMWRFCKKYIILFGLAELCILILYGVSLILPLNLSRLVDDALLKKDFNVFCRVLLGYVGLFTLSALINYVYAIIWQTLNNRYIVDVKNTVYKNMLFTKASILSDMDTGDYMMRIDQDSDQFIHIIQRNVFHFINSLILCSAIFVFVFQIDKTIAILLLIGAVLPIITAGIGAFITERVSVTTREEQGSLNGKIFEVIKGLREIKICCSQTWAENKVVNSLKHLIQLGNKTRRTDLIVDKAIYLINLSVSLLIYWNSIRLVALGKIQIGLFLALIEYISLMHKKFNWMLRIYMDYKGRKVSIKRVQEILIDEKESNDGIICPKPIIRIDLEHVTFGYSDTPVLTNVSVKLEKGITYAVVGASGIGKTTLMGLLTGLYQPQSGSIKINGCDLERISVESLRERISVVSQDTVLFNGTVYENLTLGKHYNKDYIKQICKQVGVDQVICNLEYGYETLVNTQKQLLSGGEIQRIMIARALIKDADVYVFDESTSALDNNTEKKILQLIRTELKDKIILMISHKSSVLDASDRVLFLENSQIVDKGDVSELKKAGMIKKLFG